MPCIFIYVGREHHFGGRKMSGSVSLGEIKNRDFVLALTDVRSSAEDYKMDRFARSGWAAREGSQM